MGGICTDIGVAAAQLAVTVKTFDQLVSPTGLGAILVPVDQTSGTLCGAAS